MQEGKGGAEASMNPAALMHEHHKAHHIGKSFANAHGHDSQGGHPGCQAGPMPGPENVDSTQSGTQSLDAQ